MYIINPYTIYHFIAIYIALGLSFWYIRNTQKKINSKDHVIVETLDFSYRVVRFKGDRND